MKFTLSWLKDHLDTKASLDELTTALTALGLEVDAVHDPAGELAPFKTAYVESCEQHPDADRLKVCRVKTAGGGSEQVVCGAPNAKTGMTGIFAPEGSYIPGTGITLKKGTIRGVESRGMLVSEREMGLSDAHEGIIEVGGDWPLGTPMAQVFGLDDPVIEIGLTPNRGDCAGVRGIARDLAAAGYGALKPINTQPVAPACDSPVHVQIEEGSWHACPLFIGRYIRNVQNGPSPDWMQRRLKAIGLRPISALVDITNYMSYDLCRPLHVFDADALAGSLRVSLSAGGEQFRGLDDNDYTLEPGMTVICDDEGVLALGGVMGGEPSGCTQETTNVFLETAYFDPARTAATGRALQINSDARYRFERGVDPAFLADATEIATRLILELCGGEPSNPVQAGHVPDYRRVYRLHPGRVSHLGGVDVPVARQREILGSLGFSTRDGHDGVLEVEPPSWRPDIHGEADLVEEIMRVNGFDAIPSTPLPRTSVAAPALTLRRQRAIAARRALASRGLMEAVTFSFMDSRAAAPFEDGNQVANAELTLLNPISAELDRMRPSILPNLVQAAGRNADRGYPDSALFEVGPAYSGGAPEDQQTIAVALHTGQAGPRHWAVQRRPVDAFDAKADALAVLDACGVAADKVQVTRDAPAWFHPGRSGVLRQGPKVLAQFGELHPAVLEQLDVAGPVAAAEVFLDAIAQPRNKTSAARPLLRLEALQPVYRDFAFLVDEAVEAQRLVGAAKAADKALITAANVFDVYAGKGVEPGKKSLALTVTLQPKQKTLTDQDIEAVSDKIVANVAKQTGGTLRG